MFIEPFLWIGVIIALFRIRGTLLCLRVMLKSSDKSSDREKVVFLKNKAGIRSKDLETDDIIEEIALATIKLCCYQSLTSFP